LSDKKEQERIQKEVNKLKSEWQIEETMITVRIDKSKGPIEIELKGPEESTRNLQELLNKKELM